MRKSPRALPTAITVLFAVAGTTIGVTTASAQQVDGVDGGAREFDRPPERLVVRSSDRLQRFNVAAPDAKESPAALIPPGTTTEIPGHVLHHRLIVKADDADALRAMLREPAFGRAGGAATVVEPEGYLHGYLIIESGSVREATRLAELLLADGRLEYVDQEVTPPRASRGGFPTDPLVGQQWHLDNLVNPGRDLNVAPVYASGITGAGINVGVLEIDDQNFDSQHEDIIDNFLPELTQPLNPFRPPRTHGTWVAGIIGATGNNDIGVAGVAYNSRLAALRNGSQLVTAQALAWRNDALSIKNHSWGPTNVGTPFIRRFAIPRYVEDEITRSSIFGRGGRGTIHVWASGNEKAYGAQLQGTQLAFGLSFPFGPPGARVEYSPYAGNRRVLAIGSVDEGPVELEVDEDVFITVFDWPTVYSTPGASLLASTYGGTTQGLTTDLGAFITTQGRSIFTTSPNDQYTDENVVGTSFAAPMASGVIALMLEANPNLTNRDIQHIIADTARPVNIEFGALWQINAAFRPHSDYYGFGLIDAEAAVEAARTWPGLPPEILLDTTVVESGLGIPEAVFDEIDENVWVIEPGDLVFEQFCVRQNIKLEAIEVIITMAGEFPGSVRMQLFSPYHSPQTPSFSTLSEPRPDPGFERDDGTTGYFNEVFTTFKHWGEFSGGNWRLTFRDFIPNEEDPEPDEEEEPDPDGPAFELSLAPYGWSGNPDGTAKSLTSYRVRFYGTETNEPPFLDCNPFDTACPGDLNGDGKVDVFDLILFLQWYSAGDPRADLNQDGFVDFVDLQLFLGIWQPGFCSAQPGVSPGGRPIPGGGGGGGIIVGPRL